MTTVAHKCFTQIRLAASHTTQLGTYKEAIALFLDIADSQTPSLPVSPHVKINLIFPNLKLLFVSSIVRDRVYLFHDRSTCSGCAKAGHHL